MQNEWIKSKLKEWQVQWHDYFDLDRTLMADSEFERPLPMPDEIQTDFRLIFGLSKALPQTREKCFDLFPEGKEMFRRFESYLSTPYVPLSESDARSGLAKVSELIREIGPNEPVNFSNVRIVDRDSEEGLSEIQYADDVTVLLEGSLLDCWPVEELPKKSARFFLTEPLYAAAGNFYHVVEWVTAGMEKGLNDELQTELYHLWHGGWQVLLGEEGVILAHRKV